MIERFQHFIQNATKSVSQLPPVSSIDQSGTMGVYLSNKESEEATGCSGHAKQLIHLGSPSILFFRSRLLMSH